MADDGFLLLHELTDPGIRKVEQIRFGEESNRFLGTDATAFSGRLKDSTDGSHRNSRFRTDLIAPALRALS